MFSKTVQGTKNFLNVFTYRYMRVSVNGCGEIESQQMLLVRGLLQSTDVHHNYGKQIDRSETMKRSLAGFWGY